MKPDKHFIAAAGVAIAAVCLIALTWVATTRATDRQVTENTARVTAALANQALTFTEQINRQLLTLDQTLRILVTAWERDPGGFDLAAWREQAVGLNGISRDMILTDEHGIIRQSSIGEAVDQTVSALDYFRTLANPADPDDQTGDQPKDQLYLGPATIDPTMRQWHMNAARALHHPDGSFAGVIDADFRIASITDVFSQSNLGTGALITLAGLEDGRLRGAVGPATIDPDALVGDTPMFAAIHEADSGIWTGPSAIDAVRRIHAFRHLPNRPLAVVVAMSEDEATRPVIAWRLQAGLSACCITALLTALALLLIRGNAIARLHAAAAAEDRAVLAASNAQLQVARAGSDAKAEQLEATLAGMSDGVSMIDAHLCLVEWNSKFPEIAGVPPEILRVGLPMEEILRAQIRTGQFGQIADPEAEVARRMARLRVAPFGVTQRQRPDGHTLELRRNRLPDGGFVTLYSDITEHKLAEAALRNASAAAEEASTAKSRFVATVSHEIRTPLNALLNVIRLLSESVLAPAQQVLLATARQSGDALFGLINDILDLSQIEAGALSIRPSLFELRPLLESSADMFAAQAASRGITIRIDIAEATPDMLVTDPGRLRQVLLNLLSNAIKYADPGDVWLTAEPGRNAGEAVCLMVMDGGPVIAADARARLFRPFSRLDRSENGDSAGTGLGLSICLHLMNLMGGAIGCEAWRLTQDEIADPSGAAGTERREGNAFWITLPATALPSRQTSGQPGADPTQTGALPSGSPTGLGHADILSRLPPRTRILLTEDVAANQLVTATLLRRAGHHVDVADSGPAAIRAVQVAPYDLVLMDIFMPGMSGQEATHIIRGLPEPARSVPIVALTANIGPSDEALFKAAGMNGIVGKPVSIAELLDVLHTHVWSAPACARSPSLTPDGDRKSSASPPHDKHSGPVLAVDRINELRSNLPPATFAGLIDECLIDMDHRLPALRRALAVGAVSAVESHAHALVGMAAGYGMAALEARLRTIIAAARHDDLTTLGPAATTALETDFKDAANALRALLRTEVVAAPLVNG